MSITLIAHTGIGRLAGGGLSIQTPDVDTTGANFIFVGVSDDNNTDTNFTCSDNKGNTYTRIPTALGRSVVFWCASPTVGTGHHWICAAAGTVACDVIALAGCDPVTPIDQSAQSNSTTTSPTLTPTNDNSAVLTFSGPNPGVFTSVTGTGGYTITDVQPLISFGSYGNGMAYQFQGSKTATSAAWAPATGFADTWLVTINPLASVTITPPAGSLSLASFAPTAALLNDTTPPAGSLTLATFAPLLDRTIPVPAGHLTLATFAPMLGIVVGPVPTAALVLATFPPKLTFSFGPGANNHAAAWWWTGAAARMINDAGFQLLVEPHLQDESYTGEPQPIEAGDE